MTKSELIQAIKAISPYSKYLTQKNKAELHELYENLLQEQVSLKEQNRATSIREAALAHLHCEEFLEVDHIGGPNQGVINKSLWAMANRFNDFMELAKTAAQTVHAFRNLEKLRGLVGTEIKTELGPYTITEEDLESSFRDVFRKATTLERYTKRVGFNLDFWSISEALEHVGFTPIKKDQHRAQNEEIQAQNEEIQAQNEEIQALRKELEALKQQQQW